MFITKSLRVLKLPARLASCWGAEEAKREKMTVVVAEREAPAESSSLTAAAEHVMYCFDVLAGHFSGETLPTPQFADAHCPLFVTWNKESRRGDIRLRGCIGTLEPRQLHTALRDYALTSAFRDRRFAPVEHKELPLLHCSVSLLHGFETAPAWDAWEVGKHGIIIEFVDPDSRTSRTATFLPHVAEHEGWTKPQTVESLVRKAGYDGPVTAQLHAALKVTRYQSTAFSLSYREYHDYRSVMRGQHVITVPS